MLSRRCWTGAALLLAVAWSLGARAAVLQLAPIPIEVEAPQAAAVLTLSNRASAEVALQARVFRWTQEHGEDKLTPTGDVVVSPPITSVPGGQTLTLRVVRLAKQPPVGEETYRIWIDELPADKRKTQGRSLRILMRYSVPVFFTPARPSRDEPRLAWRLERAADGALRMTARNPGTRRVRLSELQLRDAGGKAAMAPGSELSGYVLAGQVMHWIVTPPKSFPASTGGAYRLDYRTEANSFREDLVLGTSR